MAVAVGSGEGVAVVVTVASSALVRVAGDATEIKRRSRASTVQRSAYPAHLIDPRPSAGRS
jgi:hypothetical protein